MNSDNYDLAGYVALMADHPAHLVLTLSTKEPVEIGDFVSAFTSIAGQYEDFIKSKHPDLKSESAMYVREVRSGSIQADLIPMISTAASTAILMMDQVVIIEHFVKLYAERLRAYLHGGKVEAATRANPV